MPESEEPKFCLSCKKSLNGRIDKKFCDDYCRSNYNNKTKKVMPPKVKEINLILRRNRDLLKTLADKSGGKATVSLHILAEQGFNFEFFTHQYITKTENKYNFCYEYGYLKLQDKVIVVHSEK